MVRTSSLYIPSIPPPLTTTRHLAHLKMNQSRSCSLLGRVAVLEDRVVAGRVSSLALDDIGAPIDRHGPLELRNRITVIVRKVVPHLTGGVNDPLDIVAIRVETSHAGGDLDGSVAANTRGSKLVIVGLSGLDKGRIMASVLASSTTGINRDTAVVDEAAAIGRD